MIKRNWLPLVSIIVFLISFTSCDPAARVCIKNCLEIPIDIKIQVKDFALKEKSLQPNETIFVYMMGKFKKEKVSLQDVFNHILILEIDSEDKQIHIDKNNFMESEFIHYFHDKDNIIITIKE